MAALAPLNTPARQPFGILNDTKLRNLQSIKNRQNAITPNSVPNLKRRAPSPELSDSENVDPNVHDSYGKRKRAALDDDVSLSKPSRYNLHIVPSVKPRVHAPVIKTPRLETFQKPSSTPASAPAAAGRSPTRGKRMGLLQSRNRLAPPTFNTKSPSLSITAALKGTLAHKKAKKIRTIQESKPKGWFFDIFEESEEQQDYRMNEWTMTQSATILDISDDEGKMKEKSDRGKENVDPNEIFSGPVTRSASAAAAATLEVVSSKALRKDAMLDEPRTPLGDLNPTEFYGEGLDATSVVLVHDGVDEPAPTEPKQQQQTTVTDFTFESSTQLPSDTTSLSAPDDIHAILAASVPVWDTQLSSEQVPDVDITPVSASSLPQTDVDIDFPNADLSGSTSIDIWESESAKDENENVDGSLYVDGDADIDVKFNEGEVFALQEL